MFDITPCDCIIERRTGSGMITPGPSLIFSITASPAVAGASELKVYDGENATGNLLYDVIGATGDPEHVVFPLPLYFGRGIYVALTTNMGSVTIQYARYRD